MPTWEPEGDQDRTIATNHSAEVEFRYSNLSRLDGFVRPDNASVTS